MNDALPDGNFSFQLPDPEDQKIPEVDFLASVDSAWQICDRFDLQTDIWRGKILRTVRDRTKSKDNPEGVGFLNWLKDREITKSKAYSWIELADSADVLLDGGCIEPSSVEQFSKRAFIELAKSVPEVQQLVGESARNGDQITRRNIRQLQNEWTAMTSDMLPQEVREKAATNVIPPRYLAPLVQEMEKLPESHREVLQKEIAENHDVDHIKQVTAEARDLSKYLAATTQVQALNQESLNIESALEEAFRIGCLKSTADLVSQAAQIEQTVAKLYTTWKRFNHLLERVYVDSGASTPHLRSLLSSLDVLAGHEMLVQLGTMEASRTIRLQIQDDEE